VSPKRAALDEAADGQRAPRNEQQCGPVAFYTGWADVFSASLTGHQLLVEVHITVS